MNGMGEQAETDRPDTAARPTGLARTQSLLRHYWWLTILIAVAVVLFGCLILVVFGRHLPQELEPKRVVIVASALYLAVGAILQAVLAGLTSSRRLPRKADAEPSSPKADDGWPDLLNLYGWGFVMAGAILGAYVVIFHP